VKGAEMGWRDHVSPGAQDDVDGLLNAVLPFSEKMLADHGEFFPYGAAVSGDGEMRMLSAWTGEEQPPSDVLLDQLYDGVRAVASDTRAAAFVSDVRIRELDSDAVCVEMEHREGVALIVLRPYRLSDGAVEYGELILQSGVSRIW
jgi:hypothetical protein